MKHAAATLGSGDLRQAVLLPDGEDLNEWVAVNSECVLFITITNCSLIVHSSLCVEVLVLNGDKATCIFYIFEVWGDMWVLLKYAWLKIDFILDHAIFIVFFVHFPFHSFHSFFVSAVDFFNQINMLYGTVTEFCTEESCPVMSASPKYEYHWADGHTVKKPIKCSAPKYIDYLMTWVQDQLDDETLFPSKIG